MLIALLAIVTVSAHKVALDEEEILDSDIPILKDQGKPTEKDA
jgi:hypothetical protein